VMHSINRVDEVIRILCRLGITANYDGFYQAVYAVDLAVAAPEKLQSVTNFIYPEVAAKYNTAPDNVRKNIAKVCSLAWERNPALLSEIAMYELKKKPGTSEFLAILAVYVISNHQDGFHATAMQCV